MTLTRKKELTDSAKPLTKKEANELARAARQEQLKECEAKVAAIMPIILNRIRQAAAKGEFTIEVYESNYDMRIIILDYLKKLGYGVSQITRTELSVNW